MDSTQAVTDIDASSDNFTAQIGPDLTAVFDQEQTALREEGVQPRGVVAVGDRLPDASLLTSSGDTLRLAEAIDGNPAVLVFYRGSWCPYCNLAPRTYQQELLPELKQVGVRLLAISPQTPAASDAIVAKSELEFPVLSDPGNALAGLLGIVTEPSKEGRGAQAILGIRCGGQQH